ncbi:MAG: hypothetical protein QOI17_1843 [Gaiellales bacterium]|nr:hypothetical protein [Gaiellales bacterium]
MALRNGIFVHSLDHWAAAVRTPEGELRLASGRKPEIPERLLAVPGIRGVARVAEIGYLLPIVRRRLPEARLPLEGASTLGALAASVVLSRVIRRTRLSPLPAELLGAGLSLAPALASLRGSQVAGYHGAEHKAIGGYEQGEAAVEASKEHERCGSHMVGPMLAATVIGNIAVSKLPAARRGPARLVAGLAAVGVATEVFGWMTRHSDNAVSRALRRPGYELQRVAATREPTDQELEVAQAALDEVLRLEGAPRLAAA